MWEWVLSTGREFNVGHTSSDCPVRLKRKNSSKAQTKSNKISKPSTKLKHEPEPMKKKKKNVKKVQSSSESEAEEEEEDNASGTPDSSRREAAGDTKRGRIRVVHRWGKDYSLSNDESLSSDDDYYILPEHDDECEST